MNDEHDGTLCFCSGTCSTISNFMFVDKNEFPEIKSFSEEMDTR